LSERELRKVIARAIRDSKYHTIIKNRVYSAEELAEEVEKGTEVGNKFIELAVKGTLERYAKRKG